MSTYWHLRTEQGNPMVLSCWWLLCQEEWWTNISTCWRRESRSSSSPKMHAYSVHMGTCTLLRNACKAGDEVCRHDTFPPLHTLCAREVLQHGAAAQHMKKDFLGDGGGMEHSYIINYWQSQKHNSFRYKCQWMEPSISANFRATWS